MEAAMQYTLASSFILKGVSLHSGQTVRTEFRPAPENTGICFHISKDGREHLLSPSPGSVSSTELATTISDGDVKVSTIEHILAGLRGMGVDNAGIYTAADEVPILDGSAAELVASLQKNGLVVQNAPRRVAAVCTPFRLENGAKKIIAEPFGGFRVDYTIRFENPVIGTQRLVYELQTKTFIREIAPARTFGFLRDVQYLRSHGLARGGSLENVVVVDENSVVNKEGLRFPDEFVRHKILDFIGDMAMLGTPLLGSFTVECSGHGHNNAFLRALAADPEALRFETL